MQIRSNQIPTDSLGQDIVILLAIWSSSVRVQRGVRPLLRHCSRVTKIQPSLPLRHAGLMLDDGDASMRRIRLAAIPSHTCVDDLRHTAM